MGRILTLSFQEAAKRIDRCFHNFIRVHQKPDCLRQELIQEMLIVYEQGVSDERKAQANLCEKAQMKNRPTGIIRTLPYGPKHSEKAMRAAYQKMIAGLERLNRLDSAHVLIGMQQKPKIEVLHCYILVEGHIIGRAHIASYETDMPAVQCWDGSTRRHKYWAVLTAPFERAPEPIKMRGFQGFRYTEDLW